MAAVVNPVRDSLPRRTVLRMVDSRGENIHAWYHRTIWSWVPGASILTMLAIVGDEMESVREAHGYGIDQRRVTGERCPVMKSSSSASRITTPTESNEPIQSGKMWHSWASSGRDGMSR